MMTSPTPRHGPSQQLTRRLLLTAGAASTVALLAACSTPAAPGDSATAASSAPATAAASSPATAGSGTATSSSAASAASAVKELVAGFPSGVLPVMKDAEILTSSVEHGTPVSKALLTAAVKATPAAVLKNYTQVLTGQGFTAQPGDSVDGVPLKTFVRAEGQEIVTVAIVQTAATATFTLGATLLPASFK